MYFSQNVNKSCYQAVTSHLIIYLILLKLTCWDHIIAACKYNDCNDYTLNFLINLQDVLRHGRKRESVLKNTVKRLPVTLAIPFLKEVCCLHHTNTSTAVCA